MRPQKQLESLANDVLTWRNQAEMNKVDSGFGLSGLAAFAKRLGTGLICAKNTEGQFSANATTLSHVGKLTFRREI